MGVMSNETHLMSSVAAADGSAPAGPTAAAGHLDAVHGAVLALVNAQRAIAGRDPLRLNGELTRSAQFHADDMAARDYFGHDTKDGPRWNRRIRRFGFGGGHIGENIARGPADAAEAVASWMASHAGHREQILDPDYTELGVGFAADGFYWVQDFGGA